MKRLISLLLLLLIFITGCNNDLDIYKDDYHSDLIDGSYTASSLYYDSYGFKKTLNIVVNKGIITEVSFNETEKNGKNRVEDITTLSWPSCRLNYNQLISTLYDETILKQGNKLDVISGATKTCEDYDVLLNSVVNAAKSGDLDLLIIDKFDDTYTVANEIDPVSGSQEELTVTYKNGKIEKVEIKEVGSSLELYPISRQYTSLAEITQKSKSLEALNIITVDQNILNRYNDLLNRISLLREN